MNKSEQKEIKILKKLVKAQSRMITQQRTGQTCLPEWVFEAINKATKYYNVNNVSDIK